MNLKDLYKLSGILFLLIYISSCAVIREGNSGDDIIKPGAVWPDNKGNHIQAHGGGIIKLKSTYYWFGEYRGKDVMPGYRYVGCYSSNDLTHWTFLNKIKFAAPEGFDPDHWILERPKVYYNQSTPKYVMYFHLDDGRYKVAEVGVAISDKPDKDYRIVKHFRPLGMESRDIGQFIDDDGAAYLIFESRPTHGFVIARLSDDYMNLTQKVCLVKEPLEGGALVHYKGLYYMIGSHLTGWSPNPNLYATAKSLSGPWSSFKNIAPPDTKTYGSQSTMMLKVKGTKTTSIIFMGDIWKPHAQWDSRYLWMPLEIGDGSLALPEPQPWHLNIKTGEVKLIK